MFSEKLCCASDMTDHLAFTRCGNLEKSIAVCQAFTPAAQDSLPENGKITK